MSLFDTIAASLGKRASTFTSRASTDGAITGAVNMAVGKYAPRAYNAVRALQRDDLAGAAIAGVDALRQAAGISSPLWNPYVANLYFQSMRNPLLGGITPEAASRMAEEVQSTAYSKKNLFFVEIRDWNPPAGMEDISKKFNMFAVDISLGARTITSEAKPIGMGSMDVVNGIDPSEIRVTTYDDANGTVKKWFEAKYKQIAHPDGTVGVPADYLIGFNVIQSAIDDEVMALFGGHKTEMILRPAGIETEMSRSEDNMEQVVMTFHKFDTFMFQGS
jgi:hypothetical protein